MSVVRSDPLVWGGEVVSHLRPGPDLLADDASFLLAEPRTPAIVQSLSADANCDVSARKLGDQ